MAEMGMWLWATYNRAVVCRFSTIYNVTITKLLLLSITKRNLKMEQLRNESIVN